MAEFEEINVHIGEVKLGYREAKLQAILGSCVGIILLDRERGMCTLSHSLLPFNSRPDPSRKGRWVNQAVMAAIGLLRLGPGEHGRLQAVVAGGGSMMGTHDVSKIEVGKSNTESALSVLDEMNIPIIQQDTGGHNGRNISINSSSLEYQIEILPRALEK
ncbi:MAG: chemotaxis protein CheD [Lysobacterales bacterium]